MLVYFPIWNLCVKVETLHVSYSQQVLDSIPSIHQGTF